MDEWNQRVLFVLVLQCERVQRLQFPDVAEEVERRLLDFPLFRQLMKEEKKEFTEAAPKPFHMSAVFRVLSLFVFLKCLKRKVVLRAVVNTLRDKCLFR